MIFRVHTENRKIYLKNTYKNLNPAGFDAALISNLFKYFLNNIVKQNVYFCNLSSLYYITSGMCRVHVIC